jgi:hypothetical protein
MLIWKCCLYHDSSILRFDPNVPEGGRTKGPDHLPDIQWSTLLPSFAAKLCPTQRLPPLITIPPQVSSTEEEATHNSRVPPPSHLHVPPPIRPSVLRRRPWSLILDAGQRSGASL